MKKLLSFLVVIFGVFFYFYFSTNDNTVKVPTKQYFGKGKEREDDKTIRKFKINVADVVLEDLKLRLQKSRIGHEQLEDVPDFEYGFNRDTLERFQEYWLKKYDWRKYEELLNSFPQFTTEIEGLKIHFLHIKPPPTKYSKVVPIILIHGWPGNVFQFYKIIPLLTDPKAHLDDSVADLAFELIIPSIPGYGWSEQPHKRGFSQVASARLFHKLMNERLGFKKYIAQGEDWGHVNVLHMGRMFPENLYGIHTNSIFLKMDSARNILHSFVGSIFPSLMYSNPETAKNWSFKDTFFDFLRESGYFHIQVTRPDTVGIALNDSPIGLLAYILEKYSVWSDPNYRFSLNGGLENKFTMDELLTIVTIYWVNGNILSSQRYYREFIMDENNEKLDRTYVSVPVGVTAPSNDIAKRPPLELFSWRFNLTYYSELEDAGHFGVFEKPKEVAVDIIKFVNLLKV